MKKCLKIDENGFMVQGADVWIDETEDTPLGYIEIELPRDEKGYQIPLFKPKWNGTEWVEGLTPEEIEEITKPVEQKPSDIEILGQSLSEREINEIIQGQQISELEIRLLMGGL